MLFNRFSSHREFIICISFLCLYELPLAVVGTPGTNREPWGSENAKIREFSVTPPHNMEKL